MASLGKPGEDAKGSAGGRLAPDIRSALRGGGGQGTPGGLIGGRGGIDGEPVPLDSKDPNFSDYLNRIRRAIQEKWGYPCVKNFATGECKYESAELVIEFGILKNGKLQFIELRTASGLPIYDEYALNAIKFASPFPEIPQAIMATRKQGSSGLPIVAHFHYVYEVSVRTLLQ